MNEIRDSEINKSKTLVPLREEVTLFQDVARIETILNDIEEGGEKKGKERERL